MERAGKIVEGNTYGRIIPFITNSKTIKLLNNHHISYKEQGGHMYLGTRKKKKKEENNWKLCRFFLLPNVYSQTGVMDSVIEIKDYRPLANQPRKRARLVCYDHRNGR